MIESIIIDKADDFLNEREKSGNMGFVNPEFEAKMKSIGWEKGEPWCASFAKLVFSLAYEHDVERLKEIDMHFSKSAVLTYRNFDKSDWKTQNPNGSPIMKPAVGALVVWRMGTGMSGHIGVVRKVISDIEFESIEGNANSQGGKEGIEVAVKLRKVTTVQRQYSLNLLGFVLPKASVVPVVTETVTTETVETPVVVEPTETIETPIVEPKKGKKQ
jgi:hypothetical protein